MEKTLQNFVKPDTSDPDWEEHDHYWLCNAPQRSDKWFKYRKFRITGSNFGTAAGLSSFTSVDEFYDEVVHDKKRPFSEKAIAAMKHGNDTEDEARIWYEKQTGYKVHEYGLAVPKWDFLLGSSVDGIVEGEDGIIEIKCPQRFYWRLTDYEEKKKKGEITDEFHHEHIFDSHYCQMQGGMAILKKSWCDYVVYTEGTKYITRVHFNKEYWDNFLYPKLKDFEKRLENGLKHMI